MKMNEELVESVRGGRWCWKNETTNRRNKLKMDIDTTKTTNDVDRRIERTHTAAVPKLAHFTFLFLFSFFFSTSL